MLIEEHAAYLGQAGAGVRPVRHRPARLRRAFLRPLYSPLDDIRPDGRQISPLCIKFMHTAAILLDFYRFAFDGDDFLVAPPIPIVEGRRVSQNWLLAFFMSMMEMCSLR